MSISWHWQDILHTSIQKIYVTGFKTEHRLCENTVKLIFIMFPVDYRAIHGFHHHVFKLTDWKNPQTYESLHH